MARDLEAKLEHEADAKGLTGEEKQRYIGGAWRNIREREHRSQWRDTEEYRHLSRYFGTVHDVREHATRGSVTIRQGRQWYELPKGEYTRLIHAAREAYVHDNATNKRILDADERERRQIQRQIEQTRRERAQAQQRLEREQARAEAARQRAQARQDKAAARAAAEAEARAKREEARAIAFYERELAAEKRHEEREARTRARQEQAYQEAQERDIRRFQREQDADVRAIIRRGGGIKPAYDQNGKMRDAGEYKALPASVRSKTGRLTMDDAARNINAEMPWLGIETPRDLQDYFSTAEDRQHRRAAELAARRASQPRREHAHREPAHQHESHQHETHREDETPDAPASWGEVFGEAQPIQHAPEHTDLFGGESSGEPAKRSNHRHTYEPWRSDWRYMRCTKCGKLEKSMFGKENK